MRRTRRPFAIEAVLAPAAALMFVGSAASFGWLGLTGRADTTAGIVAVPVLGLIAHRWTRTRVSARLGPEVAALVLTGLGLRCLLAVHRLVNGADALVYHREGARLAESFRRLDFVVDTGRSIPGTGTLRYLAGLVSAVTGSTYVLTYLAFTVLAFAGQYLIVVAAARVLDRRRIVIAAALLMCTPSLAYWPSSIGKESAVLFGIGLAWFGASRVDADRRLGLAAATAGVVTIGLVRPHVAMIVLGALLAGLFVGVDTMRPRLAVRTVALALVVVASMWLAGASATLFGLDSFDGLDDVRAALDFTENRTSQDLARFDAARVHTPLHYPWAAVTVLFRPFPWEAPNTLGLLSAAEGAVLGTMLLAAIPGIVRSRRLLIREPLLVSAVAFITVFVFVFSAIGNFGILTRQRAQVLPFVLLLIAVGLGARRAGGRSDAT